MENKKEFVIQKLSDLLNRGFKEEDLLPIFSTFHNSLDKDVETFLLTNAINYERTGAGRTYLVVSAQNGKDIFGYFTIGLNTLHFKEKITDVEEPYLGGQLYNNNDLPSYVLFLIGKNDTCPKHIKMGEIFDKYGFPLIQQSNQNVGGSILYIDCVDGLIEFYNKLKFKFFDSHYIDDPVDGQIRLNTMVRAI